MLSNENIGEMIDLLESNYGEKAFPQDPEKLAKTVKLWKVMFQDDDPREVLIAVKDCIATLTFPPKVADIKSRISRNRLAGIPSEIEAWEMVRNAVDDATSRAEAQKAFDVLPDLVRRTVGSYSTLRAWRTIPDEQFETVIMSQFGRVYREKREQLVGYYSLPADIQQEEKHLIAQQQKPELPEPKPVKREKLDWEIRREQMAEERKRLESMSHDSDEDFGEDLFSGR